MAKSFITSAALKRSDAQPLAAARRRAADPSGIVAHPWLSPSTSTTSLQPGSRSRTCTLERMLRRNFSPSGRCAGLPRRLRRRRTPEARARGRRVSIAHEVLAIYPSTMLRMVPLPTASPRGGRSPPPCSALAFRPRLGLWAGSLHIPPHRASPTGPCRPWRTSAAEAAVHSSKLRLPLPSRSALAKALRRGCELLGEGDAAVAVAVGAGEAARARGSASGWAGGDGQLRRRCGVEGRPAAAAPAEPDRRLRRRFSRRRTRRRSEAAPKRLRRRNGPSLSSLTTGRRNSSKARLESIAFLRKSFSIR